jgi:hypothetical protein
MKTDVYVTFCSDFSQPLRYLKNFSFFVIFRYFYGIFFIGNKNSFNVNIIPSWNTRSWSK